MERTNYYQPFIQLTPLDQYSEIHNIINIIFPYVAETTYNNLYTILSGLLIHPKLAVSRSHEHYKSYNGGWYTRYYATKAQDLLAEKGLIKIKKGYRAKPGFKNGFCSVITSTDTLENLLRGIVLRPVMVDSEKYPILTFSKNALTLENIERLEEHLFRDSVLDRKILAEDYKKISRLNREYFSRMILGFKDGAIIKDGMLFEEAREFERNGRNGNLGMATNVFFTSMFTQKGCGRLFQRCQSFQNIPRGLRKHLIINGSETRQADYSGMHINLLYALCGKENPYFYDPYEPILKDLNLPSELRDVIKKCAIVALNANDFTQYSKTMRWNHLNHVTELFTYGIDLKEVYKSFKKIHGDITTFLNSKSEKAHLIMFYESNIMKRILEQLYEKNINALPLHDAVIYDAKYGGIVEGIMRETYQSNTGNRIQVKTI